MKLSISISRVGRSLLRATSKIAGFTMIELLIVIAILGILAVAVLAAINPIEQINRGRDTGFQSDAEQMLGALDRFNAIQGYAPWVTSQAEMPAVQPWVEVRNMDGVDAWVDSGGEGCPILRKLSNGDTEITDCVGSDELKLSFINRVTNDAYRGLFAFNRGEPGDSTYVCFVPMSAAFTVQANDRCADTDFIPEDFPAAVACPDEGDTFICLP